MLGMALRWLGHGGLRHLVDGSVPVDDFFLKKFSFCIKTAHLLGICSKNHK